MEELIAGEEAEEYPSQRGQGAAQGHTQGSKGSQSGSSGRTNGVNRGQISRSLHDNSLSTPLHAQGTHDFPNRAKIHSEFAATACRSGTSGSQGAGGEEGEREREEEGIVASDTNGAVVSRTL